MGLFNKNPKNQNFAGGSKNVMESIRRDNDTNTLIYLDPQEDFNTNSVITVAPNEQVIFIKNGEIYGILSSGRNEVKTENYPVMSALRNRLTGGISTFTCQVYHVSMSEQIVNWGTSSAIEIQDFFIGGFKNGRPHGVPTFVRGSAEMRVCFNILEDDNAAVRTFMRLMGDKSVFTTDDLSVLVRAQMTTKINSIIGKTLQQRSMRESINAISSELEDFATMLSPYFENLLQEYGLRLINFSFLNLTIDETEMRQKYIDRFTAANNTHDDGYNKAVQQELLKDVAQNPGAGGIASAGAGLGMGMAAGNAFATMATTAFNTPTPQQPPQPMGFNSQNRFGNPQMNQPSSGGGSQIQDPMEVLSKMKQILDAGLITQDVYDAKVKEVLSRL